MRYFYFILIYLLVLTGSTPGLSQTPDADKITRQLMDHLRSGSYDSTHLSFNEDMKRSLSKEDIELMWDGLIDNYDSLVSVGDPVIRTKDTLLISETSVEFVKKTLKLQLSIDKQGRVCGLFFRKVNQEHVPPAYINTLVFYEVKRPVPTRGIKSEGILSIPWGEGKFPLVIIVGGSGPTNKDGTVNSNKPYKELAWALAAKGIAVYRFDKRTANRENLRKSKPEKFTGHDEYAIDVQHIITALSKDKRIDKSRIFIAGHSQGGFMLPYFAEKCTPVRGYIGLAASFGSFLDILPYQYDYLADSSTRQYCDEMIARCHYMSKNLYNKNYDKDSCFPGLTMVYLQHMEKNGPAALISKLKDKPFLLIQGGRDYQVPPSELELWKTHFPQPENLTWKIFPKLNHLMMEGEGRPGPAEYNLPANVPEYVPDEIASWVFKQ